MSDLLSPILLLMEDEVDTFWCFCGLMDREANNFEIMQHFMQRQLANLGALIKYFYPQFHEYLGMSSLNSELIYQILASYILIFLFIFIYQLTNSSLGRTQTRMATKHTYYFLFVIMKCSRASIFV